MWRLRGRGAWQMGAAHPYCFDKDRSESCTFPGDRRWPLRDGLDTRGGGPRSTDVGAAVGAAPTLRCAGLNVGAAPDLWMKRLRPSLGRSPKHYVEGFSRELSERDPSTIKERFICELI